MENLVLIEAQAPFWEPTESEKIQPQPSPEWLEANTLPKRPADCLEYIETDSGFYFLD